MASSAKPPSPARSQVGILGGTGHLGYALALRLSLGGSSVCIGSRREQAARDVAGRASEAVGQHLRGEENAVAAATSDFLVLSVPFAGHTATLYELRSVVRPGQIVIAVATPLATAVGDHPTRLLHIPQGSCAEQADQILGDGARVVAALHSVAASKLADIRSPLDEDVLLAGDDDDAVARVAALFRDVVGLRPVSCGRLEVSRHLEALTPLLIAINRRHKTSAGVRIVGAPTEESTGAR